MKPLHLNFALTFFLLFSTVPAQAQKVGEQILYCVDELALGFGKVNGNYIESGFETQRFKLKVSVAWVILKHDEQTFSCMKMPEENGAATVICRSEDYLSADAFIIDRKSLRYTRTRTSINGFANENANDTDAIYAGTCETF